MNKRYYWLRLKDDFFSSKRIKKLRKLPGGDTYTIIYLKLQLLSIKSEGIITYTGLEDSIIDELALDLDETPEAVSVTLNFLLATGLAETNDNVHYLLPYALENTGSETASTIRSRESRVRKKMLQCNASATPLQHFCRAEKEIEKEKEIEIEIESEERKGKDKGKENPPENNSDRERDLNSEQCLLILKERCGL